MADTTSVQKTVPPENANVQALNAIDFSRIIGGPLVAAVNAQASAAMVTMDFINRVGFSKTTDDSGGDHLKLNTVEFSYSRQVPASDATNQLQQHKLSVPLLTMLPIPFIRIEDMHINFNVKLHSMAKSSEDNTFTENSDLKFKSVWSPVSINATTTDKNVYNRNKETNQTFTMEVDVHAVQDTMPGGLAKILSIFEDVIDAQAKENKQEDAAEAAKEINEQPPQTQDEK